MGGGNNAEIAMGGEVVFRNRNVCDVICGMACGAGVYCSYAFLENVLNFSEKAHIIDSVRAHHATSRKRKRTKVGHFYILIQLITNNISNAK